VIRSSSSSAIAASLLAGVRVGPDVGEYADAIGSADDAADHRRQRLQRADAMDVVGLSGDPTDSSLANTIPFAAIATTRRRLPACEHVITGLFGTSYSVTVNGLIMSLSSCSTMWQWWT
jgi:hypothetical protein